MKTIIAGSRNLAAYNDYHKVYLVADAVIKSGFLITEVVSGHARGIDIAGEQWARAEIKPIPVKQFPPDYKNNHPKVAPKLRNQLMADYAEALILIWDGASRGSADMLERAKKRSLKIYEYVVP